MEEKKVENPKNKTEDKKQKIKSPIAKFWDWLWHSDSWLSWVVALIFAFVTVKFIFFPILSLIMGTQLPLVVVESSSMEHPAGGFFGNLILSQTSVEKWWQDEVNGVKRGEWYEERNIGITDAKDWPLRTGFDKGDIMIVWGRFNPKVGDVIIFNANTQHPIIHRIVSINGDTIQTKGDNNNGQLAVEKTISKSEILGKAVFKIPKLGWLKLIFVEIFNALK